MTDVTLTVNGITFTFNSEEIIDVSSSIQTGIDNTEVTQSGPMGSFNYDFEGVKKTITVIGHLIDSDTSRTSSGSITTRFQQKQWLESLANGNQDGIIFTSNYESQSVLRKSGATSPYQGAFTSTQVMIDSMNFKEVTGDPERIRFQIGFKVGQP